MAKNRRRTRKERTKGRRQVIPIDVLPDDVLLAVFDFCVYQDANQDLFQNFLSTTKEEIEVWQSLVHVCRRWRSVVFGSPHRLNLRLACTPKTHARDTLDVWPTLPLLIRDRAYSPTEGLDNIVAILEHNDRVCQIDLGIPASQLEKVSAGMQKPYPELTGLRLRLYENNDETVTALPDFSMGGSSPRLHSLWLSGIPFPGLPKLLLSATHLVHLNLLNIPHSGYISPEEMVNALSTLTSLDDLWLDFVSPRSCPTSRRLPPPTRSVLLALTSLKFKGVNEYLEDLVARIDAPRLDYLYVTFFNQIIFDTPQLFQFICRTPKWGALKRAHVAFGNATARVNLSPQTPGHRGLNVEISCRELDWQVSSLEQICISSLPPPLSTLEDLYIYPVMYWQPNWKDNVENRLWLELLHPFTTVKNLYLSEEFAPCIMRALQELVGGRTTEVLPTLQNIFLEQLQPSGSIQDGIRQFVAARQIASHPIAVSRWVNPKQDRALG